MDPPKTLAIASHIRGGSECAKSKGFYPRKVNNETKLGPASTQHHETDPQHNLNSISLKWMSLHCSDSPEMDGSLFGDHKQLYILSEPWLQSAVWPGHLRRSRDGELLHRISLILRVQLPPGCRLSPGKEGPVLVRIIVSLHFIQFYRIHVYWEIWQ